MRFADAAWWEMVVATIAALHVEEGYPLTPATAGAMAFRARELGWNGDKLRAWLNTQPRPVPLPPVVVPPVVVPPPVIDVPPTSGRDAFDIHDALVTPQSPDVRNWLLGTTITEFEIGPDGTIALNFDKRNGARAWPLVLGPEKPAPGEDGKIQYTLWFGAFIEEEWHLAGCILGISRGPDDNYLPTGPTLEPEHLRRNWYYFTDDLLADYVPRPGEPVAWFVTAGNQRRGDVHAVAERSNVIVTPFMVGRFV